MCGIVGYIGLRQAYPILIKGLQRLEYRGYDSAGIALLDGDILNYKRKGKVADLEQFCESKNTKVLSELVIQDGRHMGSPMMSMLTHTIVKINPFL